jgi:hypothetical protein
LPFAANSGQYRATGAYGSSSPRSTSMSAARLVTVLVVDQTLTMVSAVHGVVRAWSAKPPHMSATTSPSMSMTIDAPCSAPEASWDASSSRRGSRRLAHVPWMSLVATLPPTVCLA